MDLFNASYRWMLCTPDYDITLKLLDTSRVILDSDVTLVVPGNKLLDLYRVHPLAPWVVTEIGSWSKSEGMVTASTPPERKNFHGFRFNASLLMIDIPFDLNNLLPPLLDRSQHTGKDMVRRYSTSLFLHAAEYCNFTMNYILSDAWGYPLENGTWTGMVGQINRGETDFGLGLAKYIIERFPIIDYVTSLQIVRTCFTFLQPKLFGTYKALVLPLDKVVWFCLLVCIVLGIFAFKAVSKYDTTSLHNDNWGAHILFALSALAQQGLPDNTYFLSTRIVYLSLLLVTFFTATYFNTAILNGLLLQAPNAIQNIEQLLDSDVKLGMVDTPFFRYEMDTLNDPLSVRVRKRLEKIKPPNKIYYEIPEAVQMIKKGYAVYTEDETVYTEILNTMSDADICSLSEVEKIKPFHVGVVARDNSPYKEVFNRMFNLFLERGLTNRQRDYWLLKKPECHWKQDALSLGLEPLFLAYCMIIIGFVLAAIAFVGECITHKKSQTKIHFNKRKY